jgi:hypothetical protein
MIDKRYKGSALLDAQHLLSIVLYYTPKLEVARERVTASI